MSNLPDDGLPIQQPDLDSVVADQQPVNQFPDEPPLERLEAPSIQPNTNPFLPVQIPKPIHDHVSLIFPEGFLWGASTSAMQVEGNNIYSDWWAWEQINQPPNFRSGTAADQYNRYNEDFDLAKYLGHNSHRLSLEWSRIEQAEGQFNESEIRHYVNELKALKDRGIKVMLTLHHFSNPAWFAKIGGWLNPNASFYFERFVKVIVPYLKGYVDFWVTINEPAVYTFETYIFPQWANAKKSYPNAIKCFLNFTYAHKKAYKVIHQIIPEAKVGIAQNCSSFEAYHKHSVTEMVAVMFSDFFTNHTFYMTTKGFHDFIGINYYFHHRFKKTRGLLPQLIDVSLEQRDVSDLGWEIHPEGVFDVLTDLSDGIPIYITECGIASTNDDRRTRFLIQYLQEVYRAIKVGVKVKGFFYWSLIDNMEMHRGFDPRFGLIEIDYATQKRTVRPSAYVYREIIRKNGIPHDLLKLLGHGIKVKDVLKEEIEE